MYYIPFIDQKMHLTPIQGPPEHLVLGADWRHASRLQFLLKLGSALTEKNTLAPNAAGQLLLWRLLLRIQDLHLACSLPGD